MEPGSSARAEERERRWAAICAERPRLVALARSRVPDASDAEDCAQEAMLRAMEFADLDEARLPQFLTAVTVRLCADQYRGRVRGERAWRRLAYRDVEEPTPEETVCDRAEAGWLAAHVAALPASQRRVVEARAQGLSCAGVAERLRVPDTTVESALARARRSLRSALEATFGVGPVALRRWWWLGGGAAATVAVTGVLVWPAPAPPGGGYVARPPRAVALGPATGGATPAAGGRAAAADAGSAAARPAGPTVAAAPAGSRPARPPRPPEPRRGQWVPPSSDQTSGSIDTGGGHGGGFEDPPPGTPEYSETERAWHCYRYGVNIRPHLNCGYPPGDPRNEYVPDDGDAVRPYEIVPLEPK